MASFEVYQDNRSEYRWRLKASNGKIMADSAEGYKNKSDCQAGIDFVKKNASSAEVEDLTVAKSTYGGSSYRW